jgi:cytochrome c oxidase subunit 2
MLPRYIDFFPEQASTVARNVDALYFFLILVTIFFTGLVAAMVIGFSIKYRKSAHPEAVQIEGSVPLEIFWTVVPLGISVVIFVWAAVVYFDLMKPPRDTMEIYVTAKQWMWKMQHPNGVREINQLHVPANTNVRLTMISQDVIHSFFVPEFRIKNDVLPSAYRYVWFNATKPGTYRLFCTEYCGTKHSAMRGQVIVMEPAAYQVWASGGAQGGTLASNGERQFTSLGCVTCHSGQSGSRGPNLAGVFGREETLADGRKVTVDDNYLRESVLNPQAKTVAGYEPIMPTFSGQVSEDTLIQLIAYIKSMPGEGGPAGAAKAQTEASQPPARGTTKK